MGTKTFERGDRVMFTADQLGVYPPDGTAFTDDIAVSRGEEGTYGRDGADIGTDWHLCTYDRDGVTYTVPAHKSQFEVMT